MKNSNLTLTVAEGIVLAAKLHAELAETEIKDRAKESFEHRFDFDDPNFFVDLNKRNARNTNGVSVNRGASGGISDGLLTATPAKYSDGKISLLFEFNGLELAAKDYNKISIRMKAELLDETTAEDIKNSNVIVYYKTNRKSFFAEDRSFYVNLGNVSDVTDWFEIEIEAGEGKNWKDYITSIRFDAPSKYAVYSIDHFVFSNSDKCTKHEWYNKYVDYVVENGIADKYRFNSDEYDRNLTRAEFCELVAGAVSEEYLVPVNSITGIPDVDVNFKNADVYLSLYRAGVLEGVDKNGTFAPGSDIRKADAELIVERVKNADKRVVANVSADWRESGSKFDIEFEGDEEKYSVSTDYTLENSVAVLEFADASKEDFAVITPKITFNNVDLEAGDYKALRFRIKPEFDGIPEKTEVGLYFKTENDSEFSDERYMSIDYVREGYVDAQGWYVAEIDFGLYHLWSGRIKELRFDAVCANGKFRIDYVRLVKISPLYNLSHDELVKLGYVSNGMLQDTTFERGFHIMHYEQKPIDHETRRWQDYCETDEKPVWDIGPWWNCYDLWENRDMTVDKYTLTDDKGINTIRINPEEKYISMRVNATKIYNGEPHDVNTYKWWPHLLLNQSYVKYPVVDKAKNNAGADRVFMEIDIRMPDFKDTINKEGANSCQFPLYFYFITDKAPSEKIWFGFTLFNDYSRHYVGIKPGWAPDSAAHQYMYGVPTASVFGSKDKSFVPGGNVAPPSDEWKHVRVDITEHIDRCVRWANRDKAFGLPVEKKDMYFGGCNIGFEIHGNYDCTFEFKNLDMVAYRKPE